MRNLRAAGIARGASAAAVLLAAALAFGLRWTFRLPQPVHQDAVDFALALERFDMLALRPHPPGYPVYVAMAAAVRLAVPDPLAALASLSALASAAATLPLAWLAGRAGGPPAAVAAAALWTVQPLGLITGTLPLSDAPGLLAALTVAVAAVQGPPRSAALRAGVLWGLAAGVRLSAWPVAAAAAWALARAGGAAALSRFLADAAAGAAPWLAWLVAQEGAAGLVRATAGFAAGHFRVWGGTPWAAGGDWPARLAVLARVGVGQGLLGAGPEALPPPWLAPLGLAALLAVGARIRPGAGAAAGGRPRGALLGTGCSRVRDLLAGWAVASAAWILLGQNPAGARHLLPLAALQCIGVSVAAARGWAAPAAAERPPPRAGAIRRRLAAGVALAALLAGWGGQAVAVARAARTSAPPAVALARDLDRFGDAARAAVLAGEEARVLAYLRPDWTVRPVRSGAYLRALVRALPPGTAVLVTSSVVDGLPPAERSRLRLQALAAYAGPPLVYGTGAVLRIFRLVEPAPGPGARNGAGQGESMRGRPSGHGAPGASVRPEVRGP